MLFGYLAGQSQRAFLDIALEHLGDAAEGWEGLHREHFRFNLLDFYAIDL